MKGRTSGEVCRRSAPLTGSDCTRFSTLSWEGGWGLGGEVKGEFGHLARRAFK